MKPNSDLTVCPLCHQANQCALEQGQTINDCWCMNKNIDKKALELALKGTNSQGCICAACADKLIQEINQ